jgi:hypothetical protein
MGFILTRETLAGTKSAGYIVSIKLLVDIIDWEYPSEKGKSQPYIWDLSNKNTLLSLYLALANGIILEMRVEVASDEDLDFIRGLVKGAGGATLITLRDQQKQTLWLYHPGDEVYQQGIENPGFMFIDPVLRPEKFPAGS